MGDSLSNSIGPEERTREVENVLCWLTGGKHIDHDLAEDFRTLDQMLPTKKFQSPEARHNESAMDWCRNHCLSAQ
jgi:hypothetical protein